MRTEKLRLLIRLYRDLSIFEYYMDKDEELSRALLRRIIGRFKSMTFWGKNFGLAPFFILPIEFFLKNPDNFTKKDLKFLVSVLRIELEKKILSYKISKELSSKRIIFAPKTLEINGDLNLFLNGYKMYAGSIPVLLVVSHAKDPFGEHKALQIAESLYKRTGSYIIISQISRIYADYNRPVARVLPFRIEIEKLIIKQKKIRFIMDLHEFSKKYDCDVVIGSRLGLTTTRKMLNILIRLLEENGIRYNLEVSRYVGGDIIAYHAVPPKVQAVQIEINSKIDRDSERRLVNALTDFIKHIAVKRR